MTLLKDPTRQLRKTAAKGLGLLRATEAVDALAGALGDPSYIVRKSADFVRQCEARGLQVNVSIVGRKGRDYFRRRTWPIRQEWTVACCRLCATAELRVGATLKSTRKISITTHPTSKER